jgi:hypothetical protein
MVLDASSALPVHPSEPSSMGTRHGPASGRHVPSPFAVSIATFSFARGKGEVKVHAPPSPPCSITALAMPAKHESTGKHPPASPLPVAPMKAPELKAGRVPGVTVSGTQAPWRHASPAEQFGTYGADVAPPPPSAAPASAELGRSWSRQR